MAEVSNNPIIAAFNAAIEDEVIEEGEIVLIEDAWNLVTDDELKKQATSYILSDEKRKYYHEICGQKRSFCSVMLVHMLHEMGKSVADEEAKSNPSASLSGNPPQNPFAYVTPENFTAMYNREAISRENVQSKINRNSFVEIWYHLAIENRIPVYRLEITVKIGPNGKIEKAQDIQVSGVSAIDTELLARLKQSLMDIEFPPVSSKAENTFSVRLRPSRF